LPCSRFLERNAEILFWTIFEIWPFRGDMDHFELNLAPRHPFLRPFLSIGRPSGFFHRRKLVGMPGAVPSWVLLT
jgi:hypothetical protein